MKKSKLNIDDEVIHIVGNTILDIFDYSEYFDFKTEDIQNEFQYLNKVLANNNIDYSKLRSVLSPNSNVHSFVFDSGKVYNSENYISPYITKIVDLLEKNMTVAVLVGDIIVNEKNCHVFSKIFSNNGYFNDIFLRTNIFVIDVINLTTNCFNRLTEELYNDEAFLFSIDITNPSIEKYAMTYAMQQKLIKYGNSLIYGVVEQGDHANYTLVDNLYGKYKLVPIDEFAYCTFLEVKPYQMASNSNDLKHSIKAIFNVTIKDYPNIEVDDEKMIYIKDHANIEIDKKVLVDLCYHSIKKNQIYHIRKNIHVSNPVILFNVPLSYNRKEYECSLQWDLSLNEARIVTLYLHKKK